MDAELKRKWIAALRSGEWKQCRERLTDGEGYCCLGVLHKILTGEEPPWLWGDKGQGIEKPKQINLKPLSIKHLSDRNDEGQSFSEIADYIEANL